MRRPGLCYTGSPASMAIYRQSRTTLPNGALCCNQHETGRREAELGAWGHAVKRGHLRALPPSSPSSPEPGRGGRATPALTGGQDPLPEAAAPGLLLSPLSRRCCQGKVAGGSRPACSLLFGPLNLPVCGPTRCDHAEAPRGRLPSAHP